MAKLALYFEGEGANIPRILDTEGIDAGYVWRIGRHIENEIVFPYPRVSRIHARIRYEEESGAWELSDSASTNGTLMNGKDLEPFCWVSIQENSTAVFGDVRAAITFSLRIDETLQQERPQAQENTMAGFEPLTEEEYRQFRSGEDEYAPPTGAIDAAVGLVDRFLSWVFVPGSVMGGMYRLSVLALFILALVAVLMLQG